jgi:hypothetical protein
VVGRTSQGTEIHATIVRLTRYAAVFEIYSPGLVLRTSEVISDFKIIVRDRSVYSGRAVVRSLVNAGLTIVCEVTLNESGWMDIAFASDMVGALHSRTGTPQERPRSACKWMVRQSNELLRRYISAARCAQSRWE